ncbi:DUF397 domain-containing protein, partial [Actinomadura hibisca]
MDLKSAVWRKASYSGGGDDSHCVELASA